jgi:plasmid stabilization system protein ParE
MALTIFWTKRASKNFDLLIEYFSSEFGTRAAKNLVLKVYDFLELLLLFPEIGSVENEENEIRAFTIFKQLNIFYRVSKDKIIILGLFDNRQNPSKKPR